MKSIQIAALVACLAMPAAATTFGPYSSLVVFGDSLSDPGNAAAALGSAWNYTAYPKGQFTNADVWAAQLGATFGSGTNFAVGGATAAAPHPPSPTLGQEIAAFGAAAPSLGTNPLTAIWIGGNDFLGLLESATPPTGQQVTDTTTAAIGAIDAGIGQLHASGLKNFVVFGLPDLGKLPGVVGDPALSAQVSQISATYNTYLAGSLAPLAGALPGATIDYFDVNALFATVLGDPGAFGITDTTTPCVVGGTVCSDPDSHLFYDGVHPTQPIHSLIAATFKATYAPVAPVPLPAGLGLLLGAVALLGGLGMRKRSWT